MITAIKTVHWEKGVWVASGGYEYNYRRVHNGRLTKGRIPADIVYPANKVNTR